MVVKKKKRGEPFHHPSSRVKNLDERGREREREREKRERATQESFFCVCGPFDDEKEIK